MSIDTWFKTNQNIVITIKKILTRNFTKHCAFVTLIRSFRNQKNKKNKMRILMCKSHFKHRYEALRILIIKFIQYATRLLNIQRLCKQRLYFSVVKQHSIFRSADREVSCPKISIDAEIQRLLLYSKKYFKISFCVCKAL